MQQTPHRTRLAESACYDFPNATRLTLRLPEGWASTREAPQGAILPELHIGPSGERPRLFISIIPLGRDEPVMTLANLRQQVQASVNAFAPMAVEEVINIHDIHSLNATGYAYRLTDSNPLPGEFVYMTQGTLIVGATSILFTLLTNNGEANVELAGLSIVQGSKVTFDADDAPRGSERTPSAALDDFLDIGLASEACLFIQDFPEVHLESGISRTRDERVADPPPSSSTLLSTYCLQRVAASGASFAVGPADFSDVDDELMRLLRILVTFDGRPYRPMRRQIFNRLNAMSELSGSDLRLRSYLRLALIDDLLPPGSVKDPDSTNLACQVLREIISALPAVPDRFLKARAQSLLLAFMLPGVSGRAVSGLEDGIEAGLAALQTLNGSGLRENWSILHLHLGIAYASRVFGDRSKNLEEAVLHYETALASGDAILPIKRAANTNIGLAYLELAGSSDLSMMQRARDHLEAALALAKKDANGLATALVQLNLGNANLNLASTDINALENAITFYSQAEKVLTRDGDPSNWAGLQHNLGNAYAQREIGDDARNIDAAIKHFLRALEVRTIKRDPIGFMFSGIALADAYMRRSDFDAALPHYNGAIRADRLTLRDSMLRTEMRVHFEMSQSLYTNAAYCMLKLSNPMDALATAELGRARELQQLLRTRSQDPQRAPTPSVALRTMLDYALTDMIPLSSDSREFQKKRHFFKTQKGEMQAALSKLGESGQDAPDVVPQYTPQQLLASIEANDVLVIPIVSHVGSATLLLKAGAKELTAIGIVWHRAFSTSDARELLLGSKRLGLAKGWIPAYFGNKKDERTWKSAISATGRLLWDRLLSEIWDVLRAQGIDSSARLVIVPPPLLSLLPWHSSWRESDGAPRFACDDYAIGYAPSLAVYASLQRQAENRKAQPVEAMRSLVVADSDPHAPLRFAALEGLQVSQMLGTMPDDLLSGEDSSFIAVCRGVKDKDLLHFACHGYFFPHDPMWSYLALGRSGIGLAGTTGNLRLRELLGWSDVRARLVILSACESAITELHRLPNESLSLASAWLSTGALAVISTLWKVDDFCTLVLMKRFYAEYLGTAEGRPRRVGDKGTIALRNAQLWLKSAKAPELANSVVSIQSLPGLNTEQSLLLEQRKARFEALPPEARPYSEPYWWSAFTYSGI